jgi:hypothetical protein
MRGLPLLLVVACSSTPAADPVPDASSSDAGVDVALDAAVEKEAGSETGGPVCAPLDIAGWKPTWHPPSGKHQGKCAAAEIETIVDECFGTLGSAAKCDLARQKSAACSACMFTPEDAEKYGPIVMYKVGLVERNIGGCVALYEGDLTAQGCGAKAQAGFECPLVVSCAPVCKTLRDLNTCAQRAAGGKCSSYVNAANTCYEQVLRQEPNAFACHWEGRAEPITDVYKRYSLLFCGPGPSDAGTD